MTYACAMYMTNFNYMKMKMCTEDCALSVHHSVCITTITGLITLNHHNRKENWIFKINLQPQAL